MRRVAAAAAVTGVAGHTVPFVPLGLSTTANDPFKLVRYLNRANCTPEKALQRVGQLRTPWKTTLAMEMMQFVTPSRKQTLGQHTSRGWIQHHEYFGHQTADVLGMTLGLRRLVMLFHDAGKAAAMRLDGTHKNQTTRTLELLNHARPQLPISDQAFELMKAMILSDPIGPYLRGRVSATKAAGEIDELAARTGMSPQQYLKAVTSYYQSDLAAYTAEVGMPHFDDLFARPRKRSPRQLVFDPKVDRIRLNPDYERKWSELERVLKQPASQRRPDPPPIVVVRRSDDFARWGRSAWPVVPPRDTRYQPPGQLLQGPPSFIPGPPVRDNRPPPPWPPELQPPAPRPPPPGSAERYPQVSPPAGPARVVEPEPTGFFARTKRWFGSLFSGS